MALNSIHLLEQSLHKVIHRVPPYLHEDLTGYLMRVAARNHLPGPAALLSAITGTQYRQIHLRDLPTVASLCRNTIEQVSQLSGYEWRISGEERRWQVNGEWLTKSVFVSLRNAKVCPVCIQEASYVRGEWSLSFYKVCADHSTRLLDHCPACTRRLEWNRRYPHRCKCGFNLGNASPEHPRAYEAALSCLIAYRIHGNPSLLEGLPLDVKSIERLAGLSLDGVCKTIWLLGHCLTELGSYGSGHGRKKPMDVDSMTARAFSLLSNWPHSLGLWLEDHIPTYLPVNFSATAFENLLAPVRSYFIDDFSYEETKFLNVVFEQHLKKIWLTMGRPHFHCQIGRQQEFDF